MANVEGGVTIHAGTVNLCIGGMQIVFAGEAVDLDKQRFPPILGVNWSSAIGEADPSALDHWCVIPAGSGSGMYALKGFQATYDNGVGANNTIWARVFEGSAPALASVPAYSPYDCIPGKANGTKQIWTWNASNDSSLPVKNFTGGKQYYVAGYVVYGDGTTPTVDQTLNFIAVTCNGSGSSGNTVPPALAALAHGPAIEVHITEGNLLGKHVAEHVGRMVWEILDGPLKGKVQLTAHGDRLTVKAPGGGHDEAATEGRPFRLVLPGELFDSKHPVVVTAR